jgi:hypothetical protein
MYEEVAVGVKNGRGDPYDMRGAAAPKYGGRKDAAGSASRTRERLNFRVVPSIPTPEPPVPPLAAHFLSRPYSVLSFQ